MSAAPAPAQEAVRGPAPVPARLRRASQAVRLAFFLSGAMFATWGVQVPAVKVHYGLGEQALALALLAAGLGAIGVLAFAGRWVPRLGPRRLVALTGVASALAVGALLLPARYAGLLLLMAGYGMAAGLFDVAMNTAAARLEVQLARPLMSGFHAFFSLGGMVGAAAGSAALAAGWTPSQHLAAASGLAALLSLGSAWGMAPREALPAAAAGEAPRLSLPTGPLLLLGLLAALGLEAEGALYDWSVLFLVQERGAPAATAALAYAAFTGAMAAGRFAGDAVRARLSMLRLLQGSGLLAAAGMAVALLGGAPWVALLGFALVGLGLANVVPLLFVAATQVPGVGPAHGIAAVSSMGYAGLMVGPPLIGFIAERSSLSVGLGTVMAFALLMTACARRALAAVALHAQAADTAPSRG